MFTALCLVGPDVSTHAGTHRIKGRIVAVSDGDTIKLLYVNNRRHKVRLDEIDAPESGQPFVRASKQDLAELLQPGSRDRVQQDRPLQAGGLPRLGGRRGSWSRAGLGWFFKRYAKELPPDRRQRYSDMEAQAERHRL